MINVFLALLKRPGPKTFRRLLPVPASFPRKRSGGFPFEVQQVTAENLCRGLVVKTLSGSVIIGTDQGEQALIGQCGQISFPRQSSTHASDGVFNAALLPRCMRVAEKGAHR